MNFDANTLIRNRIADLIVVCEANLKVVDKIRDTLIKLEPNHHEKRVNYLNDELVCFWQHTANLYFEDSVLLLCSVLERPARAKESSIATWLLNQTESSEGLLSLQAELDSIGLLELRNGFLAHKDKNKNSHLLSRLFDMYSTDMVRQTKQLLEKVKKYCTGLFGLPINFTFEQKLVGGLLTSLDNAKIILNQKYS